MKSPSPLHEPYQLNHLKLSNRVVMAPMTRMRSEQPGDVPTLQMAEYYSQRAGAGLIISEATQISQQGKGYGATPGIYTEAQVLGWRQVTTAVHAAGGRMVCQLWHVGRVSDPRFQVGGKLPVAPSAIEPKRTYVFDVNADGTLEKIPVGIPRELGLDEIPALIENYAQSALLAMDAGFDAVEIHAANGYLLDQFLRTNCNQRQDKYGGSLENRQRLTLEVVEAVSEAIGAERVGIRVSPFITFKDIDVTAAEEEFLDLAEKLDKTGIAYLHLSEVDWDAAPETPVSFRKGLREKFSRTLICAGAYDEEKAEMILRQGYADLIAFGRRFIANPDLVRRMRDGIALAEFDDQTLFGGAEKGYTDYPKAE